MKWLEVKPCAVDGCKSNHEARGYCKRHYRSLMKHGKAEQVDLNNEERKKKKRNIEMLSSQNIEVTKRGTVKKNTSRIGTCRIDGCEESVKAKQLCEKHYARNRRNGTTESLFKKHTVVTNDCLTIGCNKVNFRGGYCSTHYKLNSKLGTPYVAKTIRLCGVNGCKQTHLAKGLCKKHYAEWGKIKDEYKLK